MHLFSVSDFNFKHLFTASCALYMHAMTVGGVVEKNCFSSAERAEQPPQFNRRNTNFIIHGITSLNVENGGDFVVRHFIRESDKSLQTGNFRTVRIIFDTAEVSASD